MNFTIKDGKKYARICQGSFSDQLTLINDEFRCIVMVDKKYVDSVAPPFLNRFEKMIITFENLLTAQQKNFSQNIINNELNLKTIIMDKYKKFNIKYQIKDLLINCGKEDIQGLIYYYSNLNNEEEILNQICEKISSVLPQDIILNLPDTNKIKEIYFTKKKEIYNLKKYIDYISEKKEIKK